VGLAAEVFALLRVEGAEADRALARLAPALREAAAGDTGARTAFGVYRAFRLGDRAGGIELLTVSADRGDPVAQRSLGFLVQPDDPDRALALYRSAAEGGDGIAAFNVGTMLGTSAAAVPWLRQAAGAGVAEAFPVLGDRLSEQDLDEEALRWYLRAAGAGHPGSMFAAACRHRDGFGGPVDHVQALRWFLALLGVGNGDGLHEAHQLAPHMTVAQIREAGRLAGRPSEAETLTTWRR
jgi:TPR repeat protein